MAKDVYFIAEVGVNHEGSLDFAKKMIEEVSETGANAIKFQTYKASKLAAMDSPSYWDLSSEPTKTQYELFSKYDSFDEKDYLELKTHCEKYKLDFLSTPFDLECVEWLVPLMPKIKIASADIDNFLLLESVAKFDKEIILSVGASTDNEIENAINCIRQFNKKTICLLHCMLLYPTPLDQAYLGRIKALLEMFKHRDDIKIGYSDHIAPSEADNDQLIIAATMGAEVIEKHYTYDASLSGNDHYHSLNKVGLSKTIKRLRKLNSMVKDASQVEILETQNLARKNARRSLHLKVDKKRGEIVEKKDLIAKRPGFGISPSNYKSITGRRLATDLERDKRINLEHLEK